MVQALGQKALENQLDEVELEYIPSEKNVPLFDFYSSLGARLEDHTDNEKKSYWLTAKQAKELSFIPDDKPTDSEKKQSKKSSSQHHFSQQSHRAQVILDYSHIASMADAIGEEKQLKNKQNSSNQVFEQGQEEVIVQPKSELETALVDIYRKILNQEQISTNRSFFDMGGNSLLLVQLASSIQKQLNREISITNLFKYPSISALADYFGGPKKHKKINKSRLRGSKQRKIVMQLQGS